MNIFGHTTKLSVFLLLVFGWRMDTTQAQVTVSIDLDPEPGIQNCISARPGDEILADIVFDVGAGGISSYGVSAAFDNVELGLDPRGDPAAATEHLPAGLDFNLTPGVEGVTASFDLLLRDFVYTVDTFEAATFAVGPASTIFSAGWTRHR